jgi:hypothetical protein
MGGRSIPSRVIFGRLFPRQFEGAKNRPEPAPNLFRPLPFFDFVEFLGSFPFLPLICAALFRAVAGPDLPLSFNPLISLRALRLTDCLPERHGS